MYIYIYIYIYIYYNNIFLPLDQYFSVNLLNINTTSIIPLPGIKPMSTIFLRFFFIILRGSPFLL